MRIKETVSRISIDKKSTILQTLNKMDELGMKLLIVSDKSSFFSLISIGDIQRSIIKGLSLETQISRILRDEITVCYDDYDIEKIKSEMMYYRAEFMPVLNKRGEIVNVIFWDDIFKEKYIRHSKKLDIPVVILAGGEGTRLKPLTNIIPKPLVPVGEMPIIDHILINFQSIGVKNFYLMVNYKSDMIKNYLRDKKNRKIKIEYISEEKPLGTAGSLYFLRKKIDKTFFVTNCDILIDDDYYEFYKHHKDSGNEMTIIGALKQYSIPYGTLEIKKGSILKKIREKPEVTFIINSGMYILEPHLLNEIPANAFFHITELIDKIRMRKGKVGVFPVSEMSWLDIGNWNEYNRTQEIHVKKSSNNENK